MLSLLILRDRIVWFGNHTGYEQLPGYFPAGQSLQMVQPRRGQWARYAGSGYARLNGNPGRGGISLSELEFRLTRRWLRPQVNHVLYLENHLELLQPWIKAPKDLIGTVHLPPITWSPERLSALARLNSAIVLYQRDIPFFEQYIGRGRVRFIHHGADADFFKPDGAKQPALPRILYAGVYLRNEPMLVRLVPRLLAKYPELKFDLLVPTHHRPKSALAPLLNHPAATWHAGLSDEQLRELYQQSYLLLLPMNDSGANTVVVESLASGLPVVTTDVGGIRDYGGDSIFPVVTNNDDDAMIDLVGQYLDKPSWRNEIGQQCRQFAEKTLAWPLIVHRHLEVYHELTA